MPEPGCVWGLYRITGGVHMLPMASTAEAPHTELQPGKVRSWFEHGTSTCQKFSPGLLSQASV